MLKTFNFCQRLLWMTGYFLFAKFFAINYTLNSPVDPLFLSPMLVAKKSSFGWKPSNCAKEMCSRTYPNPTNFPKKNLGISYLLPVSLWLGRCPLKSITVQMTFAWRCKDDIKCDKQISSIASGLLVSFGYSYPELCGRGLPFSP